MCLLVRTVGEACGQISGKAMVMALIFLPTHPILNHNSPFIYTFQMNGFPLFHQQKICSILFRIKIKEEDSLFLLLEATSPQLHFKRKIKLVSHTFLLSYHHHHHLIRLIKSKKNLAMEFSAGAFLTPAPVPELG